jgi:ABC-type glycerol-3-phosphate transport system permease component
LAIVIMRGTFRAIPAELESAARIDGCAGLQILWHVMLPLAKAGLTSAVIFTFLAAWEEFLFAATIMSRTENTTVSVGINFLKEEAQSWAFGTLSAAVVLTSLPGLIIFTLGRRYYVSAFLEGALKG